MTKKIEDQQTFTRREDIAQFLGLSRMQLYRWNKEVPLPQFYRGHGNRNWEIKSWTQKDVNDWKDKVEQATPNRTSWGRRKYKLWS